MEPLISIIIPMYNSELYIEKTINSIINQTFENFELLIVDDGSTDSSYEICKKIASKDQRIIVFSKTNGGVSSARNFGIDHAKGEWILFIDSDDYINKEYIQSFISHLNNKESLTIQKGCIIIHPNRKHEVYCVNDTILHARTRNQIFSALYEKILLYSSVWGKLFNKSIIAKNNLKFNENILNGEDRLFVSDYLLCHEVNDISILDSIGYNYYMREGSITHSDIRIESYCLSNIYHLKQLEMLIKKFETDNAFTNKSFSDIKVKLYDGLLLLLKSESNKEKHCIYDEFKLSIKSLKKYNTNRKLDLLFSIFPFNVAIYILKRNM